MELGPYQLLRDGGLLGALSIAIGVIAFMWRETKASYRELLAEKDAHRLTAERIFPLASELVKLHAEEVTRHRERPRRAP